MRIFFEASFGLMVIFTVPTQRMERMYPNFVGSEAVIASGMIIFTQDAKDKRHFSKPSIRIRMEYGGIL